MKKKKSFYKFKPVLVNLTLVEVGSETRQVNRASIIQNRQSEQGQDQNFLFSMQIKFCLYLKIKIISLQNHEMQYVLLNN